MEGRKRGKQWIGGARCLVKGGEPQVEGCNRRPAKLQQVQMSRALLGVGSVPDLSRGLSRSVSDGAGVGARSLWA